MLTVDRILRLCRSRLDTDNLEDFVDVMLSNLDEAREEDRLTMDQVLYELEDFIGGHSAVSNLLCRALVEIGAVPGLSEKIYQKV
jgi:cytochrome P450 family 307 subfamily A